MDHYSELITAQNLIQVGILSVIVYFVLRYLETTVAGAFLRTIGLIAVVVALLLMQVFNVAKFDTLNLIFRYFIIFSFFAVVIIFQPELRHGLTRLGRSPIARALRKLGLKTDEGDESVAGELLKAARRFSRTRVGSMVVIEREVSLQPYVDRAVRVDAAVKAELLDTIFSTPTLLHDGAVIMRGDRIEAAGAVLPLTQNPDIPNRYGTRHRAAIGIYGRVGRGRRRDVGGNGHDLVCLERRSSTPQEDTVKADGRPSAPLSPAEQPSPDDPTGEVLSE